VATITKQEHCYFFSSVKASQESERKATKFYLRQPRKESVAKSRERKE